MSTGVSVYIYKAMTRNTVTKTVQGTNTCKTSTHILKAYIIKCSLLIVKGHSGKTGDLSRWLINTKKAVVVVQWENKFLVDTNVSIRCAHSIYHIVWHVLKNSEINSSLTKIRCKNIFVNSYMSSLTLFFQHWNIW